MPETPLVIDSSDRKPIGRTGETVSAIGIGTWAILDYERAYDALVYAIELGIDNIDTAEMYGDGKAESLVGRVIETVGKDRVFITTKLLPHRFREKDLALRAARASLSRLGLKTVDLILIHWPDSFTPIEVQIRNLEFLAESGVTRYIGVSNFDRSDLEKALSSLRSHELVVDQVKYSVLDKTVEKSLLQYAISRNVSIQAYTPLERGRVLRIKILEELGEKYGKTPVQVALNYLISKPRVIAIPKTEKRKHVEEIIGAMGWRLSQEDIIKLQNI
ncbi:MAG: aldo/keto reductase [Desulfurococcales archaeon]|nr:aldo/keto reductase [Desulfurococcales archaeon]